MSHYSVTSLRNFKGVRTLKRHRLLLSAVVLCGLLIAATIGASSVRRDLPYEFDIVPVDHGIGITNTASWNQRDLIVSYGEKGEKHQSSTLMKGSLNQCVLDGLKGNQTYSLRLKRADLKGKLLYKTFETEIKVLDPSPKYVVLVGASVGKEWDLLSFPQRTGEFGYTFGYRGKYSHDKESLITPFLSAQLKPDIVIIKECAAYFPEDKDKIMEKLPRWVDLLQSNGITPVLATCVPVTVENDRKNPGRQRAIEEVNQFIRSYTEEMNIGLLDLAAALRVNGTNGHLNENYARPDGLHLVADGYKALDAILVPSLASAERNV